MAKPVLLIVDDDQGVLRAVERDLHGRYGDRFQVMGVDSPGPALDALVELQRRGQPVALFLVDQRMPGMTGVEFLVEAIKRFPESKRVLLTAYADTNAAIQAINDVKLDHYLLKPWDPPEEQLFPVLDDLLDDWQASYRPPFEGVRILGHRWSAAAHRARDFLARNLIPYQWLDVDADPQARNLVESMGAGGETLPLLLFADGSRLAAPTPSQIAQKIGLHSRAEQPFYDLMIIGGGPAGLAAGVYGASEGLRTVMVEREAPGGQAGLSSRIENYLGFPSGLSGADLARRAVAQARRFGVEILSPQEATALRVEEPYRIVTLADGTELRSRAVLIATGVSWRTLDIPGLEPLLGAGVYYGAALTEALTYRDQEVFIVGGANSAGQAAIKLAQYARKVTMLVIEPSLGINMSRYLVDQIEATEKIAVRLQTSVVAASGTQMLESITLRDNQTGVETTLPAVGLFIFIGATPRTDWLAGGVERDDRGYILHGSRSPTWKLVREPFLLETSIPGVFVAGDVRFRALGRIAPAVGEGSMAVRFVHQYLDTVPQ